MTGRHPNEDDRSTTPLELLFDLTFVVAVSMAAAELSHSIEKDRLLDGLAGFSVTFFAIWWAWMSFTWFASAYDTDDVPYRLAAMVQMSGVLVLAAGVPAIFDNQDLRLITFGYVIMRMGMVILWIRAAVHDPKRGVAARRYITAIGSIQALWLLRLLLPNSVAVTLTLGLVASELAVPAWAERARRTPWHPRHIAERYGLFTIIVLGESVLASAIAVQAAVIERVARAELVTVSISSLVMLFALWWLYFLRPNAWGLESRNHRSAFLWGYSHYFHFSALAALGAGLESVTSSLIEGVEAGPTLLAGSVAGPLIVVMLVLAALDAALLQSRGERVLTEILVSVFVACAVVALLAAAVMWGLALAPAVALMAAVAVLLVVVEVQRDHKLVDAAVSTIR